MEKTLYGNLLYPSILSFVSMSFMSDGCGHKIISPRCFVCLTVFLSTNGCIIHLSREILRLIESELLETDVHNCIILCIVFIYPSTPTSNTRIALMFLSNDRPKLSLLETSITPVPRDTYLMTIFGPFPMVSSFTTEPLKSIVASLRWA